MRNNDKRKIIEYNYDEKTGLLEIWTHNMSLKEINQLMDYFKKNKIDMDILDIESFEAR